MISQEQAQWTDPIAGISQGNWAGPHIWAVVSTPLFQILMKEGFLAQIIWAISKHRSAMAGFGFMDDVDLCIMDINGDREQVVKWMQDLINMWAGLLYATRGALVLEKCFLYYIHNMWSQGNWQYSKNPTTQGMYIPDKNNQPTKIPQLSPSEAWRTLGVWLAPDGNIVDELQYLLEVAKSWQTSMLAAKVTHAVAEFGLHQVVLRKLKYPLIATTLMRTKCNTIMSPMLSAGLPSAGLTCTFPRAMVHGPWQWGVSI